MNKITSASVHSVVMYNVITPEKNMILFINPIPWFYN